MNKTEFLKKLKQGLKGLPKEEIESIMADYDEHFTVAKSKKKSDASIIKSLGDPKYIAKQHKAEFVVKKAEDKKSIGNIFRAAFATISLSFFNVVFVLGIFAGLLGALAGLFAAAIGIAFGGLATFIASIVAPSLPWIAGGFPIAAGIFIGIALMSFGTLFFIGNCYLAKWFYKITLAYLKFNVKIVKGESK